MALATRCPHCGITFRVASDQLKLRGGIVRCGACQQIFDGNACLVGLEHPHPVVPAQAETDTGPSEAAPAEETVVPAQAGTHAEPSEAAVPAVVPAEAGTCTEPSEAGPTEEPVVPTQAEAHAEPSEADFAEHPVVPAQAGIHAESSEAAPVEEPVVPAQAGTHAEPSEAESPEPSEAPDDAEPIYTLDLAHTFDPFGILPKPAQDEDEDHVVPEPEPLLPEPEPLAPEPEPLEPAPEPLAPEPEPVTSESGHPAHAEQARTHEAHHDQVNAPASEHRIEPTLDLPVDEELVAAALPGHEPDRPAQRASSAAAHAPLPMREAAGIEVGAAPRPASPRVAQAKARRSKLTPTKIAAPKLRVPDIDEPEFVKRSRKAEQSGKTLRIAMAAGSVLLLLALALQLAVTFRNTLAARYPAAKPALAATCKVFGCRVELPAQIDNLVIETGELTTLGANTYSLATLLRNQGSLVQAWPHVELVLTDANDKPLLRRVFTPTEYLPQGATPATGFAPRAEQPVKLYFQLDQLKPSGYRIAVFYP